MEYEKLKTAAETITMPDDMKHRIVSNCKEQIRNPGKENMMKTKNYTFRRKPAAVFAAAALCLSLTVTALAATGNMKGFFRDITNWQGAVVGTSYEQATDEIGVGVAVNGGELTVLATFADPMIFPYREIEKLGIAAYSIENMNGKTVKEGTAASGEVIDGQAAVSIRLDDMDSGSYRLVITGFVGEKKAEQPLNISGSWECAFTK